jgi:hypothetical protein
MNSEINPSEDVSHRLSHCHTLPVTLMRVIKTVSHLSHAPRFGAKTRRGRCQSPPIPGRTRCRLHGGLSPGAPRGVRNGNYRRGDWTLEAQQERKWIRGLLRSVLKPGTPR